MVFGKNSEKFFTIKGIGLQKVSINKEEDMKVIVDLCVVPLGVGVSVSSYVARCQQILEEAGLKTSLHAYGTNIEGLSAAPTYM